MVVEYKNLSESFSKIEAENTVQKDQNIDQNVFKTEMVELCTENEKLKNVIQTKDAEIKRLNFVISSWTNSGTALK